FFNSTFKRHFDQLATKFEDQSIDILDTDTSLHHWIVKVYTDVHAGGIYHYDVERNKVELLEETNPKLSNTTLSIKEPVSFQSRDGLTLRGYLSYPPTG